MGAYSYDVEVFEGAPMLDWPQLYNVVGLETLLPLIPQKKARKQCTAAADVTPWVLSPAPPTAPLPEPMFTYIEELGPRLAAPGAGPCRGEGGVLWLAPRAAKPRRRPAAPSSAISA